MKTLVRASALAVVAWLASTAGASAGIVYALNDVNLVVGNSIPAGTLSGSFTLSDDLKTLLAVNITASEATVNGFTYAATTYSLANATQTYDDQLPHDFRLDLGQTQALQLAFVGGLGTSGTFQIYNGSFEWQWNAGQRTVATGTVTASGGPPSPDATPEPSSIVMAGVALGAGGLVARRRRARSRTL